MSNHLAGESSPYLLQHANNPVDWHPWNQGTLQQAQQQNKPILLSVGYSACHWCHVMAHESFENNEIARLMNDLFINIKVDREERPDLDKIYQHAHQLLNQRPGGWPLTIFLTPDKQIPFFAGTYFPAEARQGMPGFTEVLQHVASIYVQHPDELQEQNRQLQNIINDLEQHREKQTDALNAAPLDHARIQLASQYDETWGGFGAAPKFPHPTSLERLLRHWAGSRTAAETDTQALTMLTTSLHAMASGGIYDQLGGGFFRYSVDEKWHIPHFEKMLYDNGPLLGLYAATWQATGQKIFKRITRETGQWVIREMQSAEGGYYSTLDADSEGEEGRFYVWTAEQVEAALTGKPEQIQLVKQVYGLDQPANFEGQWHLLMTNFPESINTESSPELTSEQLLQARQTLLKVREQRIRPARDEKILTAWNGLMIKGMTKTARLTRNNEFSQSAHRAIDFLRQHVFRQQRLNAVYQNGSSKLMGYLDDYVFLIDGLLESLQTDWRTGDLEFAVSLADSLLEHFEDRKNGGFYFTAHDHEALFHRPKPVMDEAIPAGNGIAAQVLLRLGYLLGDTRYLDAAQRTLQYAWESIKQYPSGHCALLGALEEYLYPAEVIIIRGKEKAMQDWQQEVNRIYQPGRLSFAIPEEQQDLPGLLNKRVTTDGVVAYCCQGMTCQPAINDLNRFVEYLRDSIP